MAGKTAIASPRPLCLRRLVQKTKTAPHLFLVWQSPGRTAWKLLGSVRHHQNPMEGDRSAPHHWPALQRSPTSPKLDTLRDPTWSFSSPQSARLPLYRSSCRRDTMIFHQIKRELLTLSRGDISHIYSRLSPASHEALARSVWLGITQHVSC